MKVKTFEGATDDAVNTAIAEWLEEMRKDNPGCEVAVISTGAGRRGRPMTWLAGSDSDRLHRSTIEVPLPPLPAPVVWLSVVYDLIRHGAIVAPGAANRGPR